MAKGLNRQTGIQHRLGENAAEDNLLALAVEARQAWRRQVLRDRLTAVTPKGVSRGEVQA